MKPFKKYGDHPTQLRRWVLFKQKYPFSRLGITFSDIQKEQIKRIAEGGKMKRIINFLKNFLNIHLV